MLKVMNFPQGSKKPKLPALYRLRPDLKWEDVMKNWKEQIPSSATPLRKAHSRVKPKGYWLDIQNRRQFFTQFAADMGFDPLRPENWRSITNAHIVKKKVQLFFFQLVIFLSLKKMTLQGKGLLCTFKGSLKQALQKTFPDMEIKRTSLLSRGTIRAQVFIISQCNMNTSLRDIGRK